MTMCLHRHPIVIGQFVLSGRPLDSIRSQFGQCHLSHTLPLSWHQKCPRVALLSCPSYADYTPSCRACPALRCLLKTYEPGYRCQEETYNHCGIAIGHKIGIHTQGEARAQWHDLVLPFAVDAVPNSYRTEEDGHHQSGPDIHLLSPRDGGHALLEASSGDSPQCAADTPCEGGVPQREAGIVVRWYTGSVATGYKQARG